MKRFLTLTIFILISTICIGQRNTNTDTLYFDKKNIDRINNFIKKDGTLVKVDSLKKEILKLEEDIKEIELYLPSPVKRTPKNNNGGLIFYLYKPHIRKKSYFYLVN